MSVFAGLEAELGKLWATISGEARAALEVAVADAKSEISALESKAADVEARVRTVVAQVSGDVKAAVAAADPGVKAEVEALAEKLVADVEAALTAMGA